MSETKNAEQVVTLGEAAALCDTRSQMYGLIARLFRSEADDELLDQMAGMLFPANTGNALIDEGDRLIATELSNLWEGSADELASDYARCFIGGGIDGRSAAYPFESVYTSDKRLTMQSARDEVLAVYRSQGLDKSDSWREGEDHIACELEFMRVMACRTAGAIRLGEGDVAVALLRTQLGFLQSHPSAWVSRLAVDMRRFAKSDFYLGLASLTEGYVAADEEFLVGICEQASLESGLSLN